MAFKKGISGNPKGRPIGAMNKINVGIKEALKEVIEYELSDIHTRMDSLSDKDRLDFIAKLLPYVITKCQNEKVIELKEPNFPEWFNIS